MASLDMLTDDAVDYMIQNTPITIPLADPLVPNFNTAPLSDRNPRLIGISGKKRHGKNTTANIISQLYGHEQRALADPLKGLVFQVNPWVNMIGLRVQQAIEELGPEGAKGIKEYGRLLQEVGTKSREILGDNVWIDACANTMESGQNYVVTDVRFKNEAQWIKDQGGVVFRVNRFGVQVDERATDHISEIDLDDWNFDAVIENDGTLLDLQGSVMIAMGDLGS